MSGPASRFFRNPIAWAALALFSALIAPRCFMRGQFLDGVTYSAIARNLAEGVGTFWSPHYTAALYPRFTEHPPLAFALQALAFRAFGDTFWVDSLWSAFLGLLVGLGTVALGRRASVRSDVAWGAFLLLLLMPVVSWTMQNDMLELPLAVFTLAAIHLAYPTVEGGSPLHYMRLVGAAACVWAAFLCKGPPALFPLAAPVLAWVAGFPGKPGQRLREAALLTLAFGVIASFFFLDPQVRAFFAEYFEKQVARSLSGQRELAASRWHLVGEGLAALAIPVLLVGAGKLWERRRGAAHPDHSLRQPARFFLAVALSASLPLLLSPKQMRWYLVPSLPFYSLALSFWGEALWRGVARWFEKHGRRAGFAIILILSVMVGSWGVGFFRWAEPRRQRELFHDVGLMARSALPSRPLIRACHPSQTSDWGLVAVLQRDLRASLVPPDASLSASLLLFDGTLDCPPPGPRCRPLQPEPALRYALFSCSPSE